MDLGAVDGETKVRHEFAFRVVAPDGVKITRLRPSCDCMSASSVELNQTLRNGATGTIRVELNQEKYGGRVEGSVYIDTDPSSPSPIVLSVYGLARGKPALLGLSPLEITATIGTEICVEFDLVRHRPAGEVALQPDLDVSDLCGFHFEQHELTESSLPAIGSQVEAGIRETHRFRLTRSPVVESTILRPKLAIAWKEDSFLSEVDLKIVSVHPLDVSPKNLFLGFVKPNEPVQAQLSFLRPLDRFDNLKIEKQSEDDGVHANLNSETGQVQISLTAPSTPGRFERSWKLLQPESNLPPVSFSVVGIVEP